MNRTKRTEIYIPAGLLYQIKHESRLTTQLNRGIHNWTASYALAAAGAAALVGLALLSFLVGPINEALSAGVWKRPWPNLDEVSMNFSSIFSRATRLALVTKACKDTKSGQ